MIQWATVFFYLYVEEVLISSGFPSIGGAKVLNAWIFLFYRRWTADFCFAPPYGKNQKVDRFIKRLQRKIKLLFLDIYLLRISAPTGRVNVPADFDTIEKAFSGVKTAEEGINKGFRGRHLTSKALADCPKTKKILVKRKRMWYN